MEASVWDLTSKISHIRFAKTKVFSFQLLTRVSQCQPSTHTCPYTTFLWNVSSSMISHRFKLFHTSQPYNTPGITTCLYRLIEVFGLIPHGHTPISAMLKKDYVPLAHASLTVDDSDRLILAEHQDANWNVFVE